MIVKTRFYTDNPHKFVPKRIFEEVDNKPIGMVLNNEKVIPFKRLP